MTENITVTITTPSEREAVVTRGFDAPARLVFDALTKPDLIKRWYGPPGSIEVVRERCPPRWIVALCQQRPRQADRAVRRLSRKSDAPTRFVRTERWEDWDPGETLVTVALVEERGKTMMTQSIVFPSQEVRDVVMKGGLTPKGTSAFYDRLRRACSARWRESSRRAWHAGRLRMASAGRSSRSHGRVTPAARARRASAR